MNLDPLRRWERRIDALPMPSAFTWAVLTVAFLGGGMLIGRAVGSGAIDSLDSSRAPLKLLIARAPAPTPSTTSPLETPAPPPAETTPEPAPAPEGSPESAKSPSESAAKPFSEAPSKSKASSKSKNRSSGSANKTPAIKHIFVVMLDDEPYSTVFGPASTAHYLAGTLEKQGTLIVRYYAVAHEGLADGIALIGGQGPTEATAADCPTYSTIAPISFGSDGQILGNGCVYPATVNTLADQLSAKHLTWKAYVEGMDEGAPTPPGCAHPALGASDPSATSPTTIAIPGYQTWRNPFVYFDSISESAKCAADDVGMNALSHDLASPQSTPNFAYIAPGPCDDGNATPCGHGKAGGMAPADAFLEKVIPKILSSKAYKQNGLLAITVDQAPSTGEYADSSSCCGQPTFPNLPAPTGSVALSPTGGGQVGLLLLSPFIKKGGQLAQEPYNHFSLLATIEQLFSLGKLGYVGLKAVKPFSASLLGG